jgi:hypothetical protein
MPRKPIGDKPMTTAERQARVRAGAVQRMIEMREGLDDIERLAWQWHKCVKRGRPGATDKDIQDAFSELALKAASLSLVVGAA